MTLRRISNLFPIAAVVVLIQAILSPLLLAQGPLPEAPSTTASAVVSPVPVISTSPARIEGNHRFWDRQNTLLFAANAALSTADFAVTRANLQSGGQELNPVVRVFGRSTAGLAMNFAGETAGVVGMSYFFHRTGHHKLERAVSYLNLGGSAGAVTYGFTHR